MNRRRNRGFAATSGFSLIEMLAAIAVLALIIGVGAPLLRAPPPGLQLQASVRKLCMELRATRARAIGANAELALAFDLARNSYSSPSRAETFFPPNTRIEIKIADVRKQGGRQGDILFFPSGASTGGEITLSLGGRRATVDVNFMTGAARCNVD